MQKGQNYFTFYCSDISGSPVTGATSGSFSIFGNINSDDISLFDSTITEESSGYYTLGLDIDAVGQGYFGVKSVTANRFITPDFWSETFENNDFDSLYSLFLSLQQAGTVTEVTNYVSVNTNPFKESDDITLNYIVSTEVTPNLTGWTNFKAELRNNLSLTSATSASYLGLGQVTIVDALTNSVSIDISGALTTGVVPEGSNTTNLYMDLQGVNASGKKKTLIEFSIPIIREITYN
jgi:hypothetical protein